MATGAPSSDWERYVRDLGIRLQQLRVERGLSQERLAGAASVTAYTYRKLEKGESNPGSPANPRLRTLAALAEVLGVSLADLLPAAHPGAADGR